MDVPHLCHKFQEFGAQLFILVQDLIK